MVNTLYPFRNHVYDLDGLRYHYLDEGKGNPVVMVHGNPTWSFYYRNLVMALRETHRTVVPDHIGCGYSDKPTDEQYSYTLSRRVADLTRLINHLNLDEITLVVHDWGGMIGLSWAVRHLDRVKRLVIMNTAAFHLPRGKSFPVALTLARTPLFGALLVRGGNAFSRGANRFCVTQHAMSDAVARGYLEPYSSWKTRIAVHRFVQDIPLKPTDPSYAYIEETSSRLHLLEPLPMLICWGMRDFVFDKDFLAEWEHRFPHAEVHRFDNAGHYVLEDATDEIVSLIQTFLTTNAAPLRST